jgi:hypothetical protein
LADSYIGKLYTLLPQLVESSQVTTIFEAWSMPEDSVKSQEITLEYFTTLGSELNRRIIDFTLKDNLVYSIVCDGSYYYISETTIGTKISKLKKVFPETYNSFKIIPYSFGHDDLGEILVFSIMRNHQDVYLGVSRL